MHLSKVLRHLEEILAHALKEEGGKPARDMAARLVSEVHQAMIEAMLKVPTFNMQLEALREIKRSLQEAAKTRDNHGSKEQLKGIVAWMEAKKVLPHILRPTYLHHKQYVDQVAAVLRFLLEEDAMTKAHIDELWAITQKQDTFEEVKNNVLDLLASLAWKFSDEQLDYLFTLFEGAGHDALADCGKILETVQKLAGSDGKGVMAERLLELLWRMTHDAGGAEMVAAFTRVLGHYDRMERASKSQWMARVVGDIRERRADLAVSLRLVIKIVQLESPEAAEDLLGSDDTDGVKGKKARRRRLQERQQQITVSPDDQDYKEIRRLWIEQLIAGEDLLELLTSRFEEFQAHAWSKGFDRAQPAPPSGQPGAHRTGYQDTLKTFMEALMFVLKTGCIEVDPETALRFWAAFVDAPGSAVSEPLDPGVKPARFSDYGRIWITKMLVVGGKPCSVSPETVRTILETRLVNEPAARMRKQGTSSCDRIFCSAPRMRGNSTTPSTSTTTTPSGTCPWAWTRQISARRPRACPLDCSFTARRSTTFASATITLPGWTSCGASSSTPRNATTRIRGRMPLTTSCGCTWAPTRRRGRGRWRYAKSSSPR